MANLTPEASQPWKLSVDQAGTAILATAGKFLDRNIQVEVPSGVLDLDSEVTATTKTGSEITATANGSLAAKLTTTKPDGTDGTDYLTVVPMPSGTAASATIKITATAKPTTNGFVSSNTSESMEFTAEGIAVTQGALTSYYLPKSTLGIAENVDEEGKTIDKSFTTESILRKVENQIDGSEDGSPIDKIVLSFSIPEGYHDASTFSYTINQTIPDFSSDTSLATAGFILSGSKAYDQNGLVLVGTMYNGGPFTSTTQVTINPKESSGTVVGSNVTLSDEDTSGISVTGNGAVTPLITLGKSGYYEAGTYTGDSMTSNTQTKYITALTIGEGKSINITNNGKIGTLSGSGTIESVTGDVIISNTSSTATVSLNGKQIIGESDNGVLPTGSIEVVENTTTGTASVQTTRGWVDANGTTSIAAGSYSVSCAETDPSITYNVTASGIDESAISESATSYFVTVGGTVTAGTHTATASVTKGYIGTGAKSTEAKAINVTGSAETKNIYLKSAEITKEEPKGDSATISNYNIKTSAGYTSAYTIASIPTYAGVFEWA